MARKDNVDMRISVPFKLRQDFRAACIKEGKNMADVLIEFMESYAKRVFLQAASSSIERHNLNIDITNAPSIQQLLAHKNLPELEKESYISLPRLQEIANGECPQDFELILLAGCLVDNRSIPYNPIYLMLVRDRDFPDFELGKHTPTHPSGNGNGEEIDTNSNH